ncbi:hypothetical protein BC832DRAFT_145447 [Gaertneriomyces semiglobifer]|nr:hypothetical protein BC832DRAFT_145447 [Gaertneriomyces semiglobifer]
MLLGQLQRLSAAPMCRSMVASRFSRRWASHSTHATPVKLVDPYANAKGQRYLLLGILAFVTPIFVYKTQVRDPRPKVLETVAIKKKATDDMLWSSASFLPGYLREVAQSKSLSLKGSQLVAEGAVVADTIGNTSDSHSTVSVWERPSEESKPAYRRGVVFYVDRDVIVGAVLWGLSNKSEIARSILESKPARADVKKLAKALLFD